MTKKEAMQVIIQAVRSVNANADVHDKLNAALVFISKELEDRNTKPMKDKKSRQ